MNENYRDKIEALIFEASLPQSPSKAQELLHKAVELAMRHQDELLLFEARAQYMMACFRSGYHDKSLAIFPTLKAYAEQYPQNVNPEAMMVFYMSVVNGITEFPSISIAQIKGVLAEMEIYYRKHGYTLKEAYRVGRHAMLEMGKQQAADQYLKKIESAVKGPAIHACQACNAYSEVTYLDHFGKYQQAIDTAQPLIHGSLLCNLRQQIPYAALLLSCVETGNWEMAVEFYNRARQVKEKSDYEHLWYVYKFLFFQVLTRNIDMALQTVKTTLERATAGHSWALSFLYYLAARFLFSQLSRDGLDSVNLGLPPSSPVYQASGYYSTKALADWFDGEIERLQVDFDNRNGNRFFSDLNRRHKLMERHICSKQIPLEG